jgi:hypothetical protein
VFRKNQAALDVSRVQPLNLKAGFLRLGAPADCQSAALEILKQPQRLFAAGANLVPKNPSPGLFLCAGLRGDLRVRQSEEISLHRCVDAMAVVAMALKQSQHLGAFDIPVGFFGGQIQRNRLTRAWWSI